MRNFIAFIPIMKYILSKRFRSDQSQSRQQLVILQYIVFGSLILYVGRTIFIPLSFALLISFILQPICGWLEQKKMGRAFAIFISLTLLFTLLAVAIVLLINQFTLFLNEWPTIQLKVEELRSNASRYFIDSYSISKEQQQKWIDKIANDSLGYVVSFIQGMLFASVYSIVMLILIPVYAALILYYRQVLIQIIAHLFPKEKKEETKRLLSLTIKAYYNFIKGMALVYVIVGVLNSVGLLLIGVPHAIFFGFIASILTFIPYIGIMVGSLLPITMAWITYGSVWYPVAVILVFTFVQYLEANIIFPLAVSNRLSINPLATLIAIMLGGIFWGVSGMILFVPFLAILKLIADHHPSMKLISLLAGK